MSAPPNPDDSIPPPSALIVAQAATFSGPLPPPGVLRQYEDVIPGAAERILKMAESQARHRQQIEKTALASDIRRSLTGLGAGLVVSLTSIVAGSIFATGGQPWAGAISQLRRLVASSTHSCAA